MKFLFIFYISICHKIYSGWIHLRKWQRNFLIGYLDFCFSKYKPKGGPREVRLDLSLEGWVRVHWTHWWGKVWARAKRWEKSVCLAWWKDCKDWLLVTTKPLKLLKQEIDKSKWHFRKMNLTIMSKMDSNS